MICSFKELYLSKSRDPQLCSSLITVGTIRKLVKTAMVIRKP